MDGEYIEMCLQAAKTTADIRFGVKHERAMVELGNMREELFVLRQLASSLTPRAADAFTVDVFVHFQKCPHCGGEIHVPEVRR